MQIALPNISDYLLNGHKAQQNIIQTIFQSVQLNINNPNFLIMQGCVTKLFVSLLCHFVLCSSHRCSTCLSTCAPKRSSARSKKRPACACSSATLRLDYVTITLRMYSTCWAEVVSKGESLTIYLKRKQLFSVYTSRQPKARPEDKKKTDKLTYFRVIG